MRKCKHPHRLDRGFTVMCLDCERNGIESLGPSNDEPTVAQEEIEAAAIADNPALVGATRSGPSVYGAGWMDHAGDNDPPGNVGISWRAGWLGRELIEVDQMTSHAPTHDASAWPWNPALPIAGQYETHLANVCNHASRPRNADGDCMRYVSAKTAAGVAQEDTLRAEVAKQHTDDKALRREAYALNAPVREFAEELAAALQSSPPDAMDDEQMDDVLPDEVAR